jgi:uncharacterized protein DUF4291
MTKLAVERYLAQEKRWPAGGRVILANFDADSVVVYQAYRPAIGAFAATRGFFGGEFSLNRMSWIKPNFLWMMHRSGWGVKEGQEITLAVRIKRRAFDDIIAAAVYSSFDPAVYGSLEDWQRRVAESDVRLQWDPDHGPDGRALERRAVQLGMRGEILARYAREWIVDIEDISDFVRIQREVLAKEGVAALTTPREEVYPVDDAQVASRLGLR